MSHKRGKGISKKSTFSATTRRNSRRSSVGKDRNSHSNIQTNALTSVSDKILNNEKTRGLLKLLRETLPNALGNLIVLALPPILGLLLTLYSKIGLLGIVVGATMSVTLICAAVAFKQIAPSSGVTEQINKQTPKQGDIQASRWKYPRLRFWALCGLFLLPLMTIIGIGIYVYQQNKPPDKFIVLIANFDGPEPQNFRVTETVMESMTLALKQYNDVRIERVTQSFDNLDEARSLAKEKKAAIITWGWYGVTSEKIQVSVHLEIVCKLDCKPDFGPYIQGQPRTLPLSQINSYSFQGNLSSELTYVSLIIAGLSRASAYDNSGAIDRYTEAEKYALPPMDKSEQSIVYFIRSQAYLIQNNLSKAIDDITKAISLEPSNAVYYDTRANFYLDINKIEEAITDFKISIKKSPMSISAHSGLGLAYTMQNDLDLALAEYNRALAIKEDTDLFEGRALVYYQEGEYDKAIDNYNNAIRLESTNSHAYIYRGDAYKAKQDYDHALSDYSKAIDIESTNVIDKSEAYHKRALIYMDRGFEELAIKDLDRAISLRPRYPQAYHDRGYIYYQRRDRMLAISDFLKVREMKDDPMLQKEAGPSLWEDAEILLKNMGVK